MTPKPMTTEELAPFMDQGWRDAYLPPGMEKLLADALHWRETVKKVEPIDDHGYCIFCMRKTRHKPDCPWVLAQEAKS